MELVYLWIEKYKNIKEEDFNFSPEFKCEFKAVYDENGKLKNQCDLIINRKRNYINIFPEKINVTAIVGENGSGKSNLIDKIFNFKVSSDKWICIFNVNNKLIIHGANFTVNNSPTKELELTNLEFDKDNTLELATSIVTRIHTKHKLAYFTPLFSNTFTINKQNFTDSKFNLSPLGLIENFQEEQKIYEKPNIKNLFSIYESNMIQFTINLIKQYPKLKLPFPIPSALTIRVNPVRDDEDYIDEYGFLKDLSRKNDSFLELITQRIIKNFFENSFNHFYNSDREHTKLFLEAISNELKQFSIIDLITIFGKGFKDENGKPITVDFLVSELEDVNEFLQIIEEVTTKDSQNYFYIDIQNINENFIPCYNKVISSCSSFLDFEWNPTLSTGQNTFLFQFSLFNQYLKSLDSFVLLIDEGESTLHPNWQKMYIKFMIDFFEKNYPNKKIHIIYSTHSPYLLSDLPKENVIFLKKDEIGNCKNVTNIEDIEQTFGANIHTLLSHGFFMEDGLMGEFAKDRINLIIKKLNDKKFTPNTEEKTVLLKTIKLIGEDFLKTKLLDMYYKKFNDDYIKEERKKELLTLKEKIDKELEDL